LNSVAGEFDRLARRGHLMAFDVEEQRAGGETGGRLGRGGLRAAQERLRAKHELARVEGLGHVIVGAGLEALHLVDRLPFRREEDHGRVLQERVGADHAEQLHFPRAWASSRRG
jgi:hypothetical protein